MKSKWWPGLAVAAVAVLLPELFIDRARHMTIDGFGFYAWFGWVACLLVVIVALLVGRVIERGDDYYDD